MQRKCCREPAFLEKLDCRTYQTGREKMNARTRTTRRVNPRKTPASCFSMILSSVWMDVPGKRTAGAAGNRMIGMEIERRFILSFQCVTAGKLPEKASDTALQDSSKR
jgi:hypothetical protein